MPTILDQAKRSQANYTDGIRISCSTAMVSGEIPGRALFDRHRVRTSGEEYRCLSAKELRARGYVRRDDGVWTQPYVPPAERREQVRMFRVGRWAKRKQRSRPTRPRGAESPRADNLRLFPAVCVTVVVLVSVLFPSTQADSTARRHFAGQATYFEGSHGACTPHFVKLYAANRHLPCGSKVRLRHAGRSVIVTIQDRGPYGSAVLDLAPAAFRQLAPLSRGRIWVYATVLRRGP